MPMLLFLSVGRERGLFRVREASNIFYPPKIIQIFLKIQILKCSSRELVSLRTDPIYREANLVDHWVNHL